MIDTVDAAAKHKTPLRKRAVEAIVYVVLVIPAFFVLLGLYAFLALQLIYVAVQALAEYVKRRFKRLKIRQVPFFLCSKLKTVKVYRATYVERVRRGVYKITERGEKLLEILG